MSRQKQDRATSRLTHARSVRSLIKIYLNGIKPALKGGQYITVRMHYLHITDIHVSSLGTYTKRKYQVHKTEELLTENYFDQNKNVYE